MTFLSSSAEPHAWNEMFTQCNAGNGLQKGAHPNTVAQSNAEGPSSACISCSLHSPHTLEREKPTFLLLCATVWWLTLVTWFVRSIVLCHIFFHAHASLKQKIIVSTWTWNGLYHLVMLIKCQNLPGSLSAFLCMYILHILDILCIIYITSVCVYCSVTVTMHYLIWNVSSISWYSETPPQAWQETLAAEAVILNLHTFQTSLDRETRGYRN